MNHRHQLTPNIINLIIRSSHNLNQRRRVPATHRLTRQILKLPATRAAMIRTPIKIAFHSPTKKLRRTNSSKSNTGSRPRALTHLLRRNHLRPTINKSLIQQRLRQIRLISILSNTTIISRTPKLPIILTKRGTTLMPVRNTTMLLNPSRPQITKRRKINNKLKASHLDRPHPTLRPPLLLTRATTSILLNHTDLRLSNCPPILTHPSRSQTNLITKPVQRRLISRLSLRTSAHKERANIQRHNIPTPRLQLPSHRLRIRPNLIPHSKLLSLTLSSSLLVKFLHRPTILKTFNEHSRTT